MAYATTAAHAQVPASSAAPAPAPRATDRAVLPDPGPWLVLAAPITFALTLAVVLYMASTSF
jgi:hypothetical protein